MDFARAVKGRLTRNVVLREVDSQSEIELGRHLDPVEKKVLFSKYRPQHVLDRIYQVDFYIFNFQLYYLYFSLGMGH